MLKEESLNIIRLVVTWLFATMVVLFAMTRYADFDLWWHIKLGEIVFNTGKPFFTDTFSYTFSGKPQYAGEWLADLLIFLSFQAGGITGINLLKAVVLLLTCFFLYKAIREEKVNFTAAIVTLVVVLFAIRFRLFVRPYLFSLLFTASFLYILNRSREQGKERSLLLLPVLQVLWANMSVGAIFGPVIYFLFALADVIQCRERIFRHLALLTGLLLCTLANPEFWRIWTLTLDLSGDPYRAMVGEYQPMSRQILWGFGFKYTFGFQLIALGGAIYFVFLKGWRNLYLLALYFLFLAESMLQVRMVEFFSLVAAPAFAFVVQRLYNRLMIALPCRSWWLDAAVGVSILIVIPVSVIGNKTYVLGNDIKENAFPEEALTFLDRERITGTMFNSYSFGGYIVWRSPERKVFFDGRYRRLYDPDFYKMYSDIMVSPTAWKAAEERFGFDYALVEYDMLSRRFPLHLNQNPDWALVYWNNHSAVYLKRTTANRDVIAAHEYRIVKPTFYDFSYLGKLQGESAAVALPAITREIGLNPQNKEPLLARVFVLYNLGFPYFDMALKDLSAASHLKPNLAMEHSARAYIMLAKGQDAEAKEEVRNALKLDPLDLGALELGNKLGMEIKLPSGMHH